MTVREILGKQVKASEHVEQSLALFSSLTRFD